MPIGKYTHSFLGNVEVTDECIEDANTFGVKTFTTIVKSQEKLIEVTESLVKPAEAH